MGTSVLQRREQTREYVLDWLFEERQTSADNAATGFNRAPQQGFERAPSGILGCRANPHSAHTDNARDADEETKTKHDHDPDLAHNIQLELRQQGHRHQADKDVSECVVSGPAPAEDCVVDAGFVGYVSVPVSLDRYALEDRSHDEAKGS